MEFYKYVILGGGLAAGYAAESFAEHGVQKGELLILSDEKHLPYERPPLSKDFLAGKESKDDILINAPDFYTEYGIEVRLNTHVDKVDLQEKRLYAGGAVFGYEKLLIATGSRLRKFDLPGADLPNIYYLRRIGDARQIRQAAENAKRAVVIGGSFIGMEVTSVLQQAGVETTMVFPESRVWEAFFTPQMSAFFEAYYRERGVDFVKGVMLDALEGNGRITHVALDNGRRLPADMVVAGIGVMPNTTLFEDTRLKIDDGILVNRFLETNVRDVFAVGDVARYRDVLFDTARRVEHWDNAFAQGQHVAQVMLGEYAPFEHVPYFFSDVFDLSYELWGDTAVADKTIHRGDVQGGSFSVWWLKDKQLKAAFVIDRPDEERELAQQWIKSGETLNPEALADADQPLRPAEEPATA